jgi:CubicO group peptidase (beta-lactamase class C family)
MNYSISQIEKVVEEVQERFQIPSVAMGVIDQGNGKYLKGFGNLSINDNHLVDENTIFALASISKSTASASLSILVDEGTIEWSDSVKKYLPDFAFYDPFTNDNIKVRDLLIHNSGLPSVSGGTIWYDSKLSRKEVMHRLRYLKPVTSFRTSYAYQNVCYLVVGEIIEAVTGETWDDFIATRIFAPLGMKRTTTKLADLEKLQNFAKPHTWMNGQIVEIPYRNHENVGAGAAINSSARDWLQYVELFLNNGSFNGEQIISSQRIKEMWAPQTIIPDDSLPSDLDTSLFNAYGMGWFLREYNGQKVVNHSGGVDGMRSQMCILPNAGVGFIIFTNLEPGYGMKAIYYAMLDILTKKNRFDWVSHFESTQQQFFDNQKQVWVERQEKKNKKTNPSYPLTYYCGMYFDPKVGNVSVHLQHDYLRLDFDQSRCFHARLSHWENDTFEIIWDDRYIPTGLLTFKFDDNGCPEQIIFDQPNLLDVDFSELEIYWIKNFDNEESKNE